MKPETTPQKADRQTRGAVKRLVTAVERMIEAAKQAEEARDQLLGGNAGKGRRDG